MKPMARSIGPGGCRTTPALHPVSQPLAVPQATLAEGRRSQLIIILQGDQAKAAHRLLVDAQSDGTTGWRMQPIKSTPASTTSPGPQPFLASGRQPTPSGAPVAMMLARLGRYRGAMSAINSGDLRTACCRVLDFCPVSPLTVSQRSSAAGSAIRRRSRCTGRTAARCPGPLECDPLPGAPVVAAR